MVKKIIISSFLVFTASALFANTFTVGLNATANVSNMDFKFDNIDERFNPSSVMGYQLGVIFDLNPAKLFSLNTGLMFSAKGFKNKVDEVSGEKEIVRPSYVEIPVNAMLHIGVGDNKILFYSGVYLAYGISGTYKLGDNESDIDWAKNVSNENVLTDTYNPVDYGLNFGTGVRIKSIRLTLQYSVGLQNISASTESVVNNSTFGLSAAYLFLRK